MTHSQAKVAVSVENLSHAYNGRPALRDVSFDVARGEFFGILGPNGGGKSTTFRILATLLIPTSGRAFVWGHDVTKDRDEVRRQLGVAFQAPALDVKLTVRENLKHHGHLYGISGRELNAKIDSALDSIGLRDREREMVETLSGGLRRRIELAKALMPEPTVLLLDEPTVGLDPLARDDFWELVQTLRARTGMTVLVTTHLLSEGTACDRIAILDNGQLAALDDPATLCAQIQGEIVTLHGRNLVSQQDRLATTLDVRAERTGEALRFIVDDGAAFVARVRDLLGETVESVSIARPTLSDVFREKTGHAFESGPQLLKAE